MLNICEIDKFLIKREVVIPFKTNYFFYENKILCTNSLIDMCLQIKDLSNTNDDCNQSSEFLFANTILAFIDKDYSLQRENSIKLLFKKDEYIPVSLLNAINCSTVFFEKKDNSGLIFDRLEGVELDKAHPYFKFIYHLLGVDSNKKIEPYINALKKMYDGNTVDQEILIYFYEYFHEIIKSKLKVLEVFT